MFSFEAKGQTKKKGLHETIILPNIVLSAAQHRHSLNSDLSARVLLRGISTNQEVCISGTHPILPAFVPFAVVMVHTLHLQ